MQNLEQMTLNRKEQYLKEQYLIDAIKYILEKTYNDLFPIQAADRYEAHTYQTDTATIDLFMNWSNRIQKPQYLKLFTGRGNIVIATNKAAVDGACNAENPYGYIKDYWGRPGNTEIVVFPGLIAALYISENLEQIVPKLKQLAIAEPAKNPFIIGDCVTGDNYKENKQTTYDLAQIWLEDPEHPPVLLTGPRRGGKSSALLNLETSLNGFILKTTLNTQIKVAYTSMLRLSKKYDGLPETLLSITDAIAKTLETTPPTDEDMMADPRQTFNNFLNSISSKLDELLIIALDEWEAIPEMIDNSALPIDFPEFLLNSIKAKNIALIIAGLHDFEDIERPYLRKEAFSHVKLKSDSDISTTESLLTQNFNYEETFFNYEPAAIEKIKQVTCNQPYLIQNIGWTLIWNYNCLTEDTKQFQGHLIAEKDVEEVINNQYFFSNMRYFFTGLWQQAKNLSEYSHAILDALAKSTKGLTTIQLESMLDIEPLELQKAINLLEKRQIIAQITPTKEEWKITIELFKIWILNHRDS